MTSRFLYGQVGDVGVIHPGKEYQRRSRLRVDKRSSISHVVSLRLLGNVKVVPNSCSVGT